jgi:TRAP-type transport system periplasmic protein
MSCPCDGAGGNFFRADIRRSMMNIRSLALSIVLLTTAGTACAQEKIVWQHALSAVVPNTVYMVYAEEIIPQRIMEATNGRLEIIPHRAAVKNEDVLDAVRDRRFDIGVQGTSYRPDLALFDFAAVPGFADYEEIGPKHAELYDIFRAAASESFDVELLGFGYWPVQSIIANEQVATVEDLKGLKLRASSVGIQKVLADVGAAPVNMAFGDIYVGLQRGTIDGAVSGAVAFLSGKWYENAKFASAWPLGSTNYLFLVNKDAWAELPADLQEIVQKVIYDAALETWQGAANENKQAIADLEKHGVEYTEPDAAEREKVAQAAAPLIDEWLAKAGERGKQVYSLFHAD